MSLSTPTTKEISDNIIAQLEAILNQTIPLLPKAFNRVLSKAIAAVYITLYKYVGFMFLQVFVKTASIKDTTINGVVVSPLTFWGRLIGVGDPTEATSAVLNIAVTVQNQTGTLPANTQLLNSDNGVTYLTKTTVALSASTIFVGIEAAADQSGGDGSGAIGNLEVGDLVSFANPLPNIDRVATVDSQVTTGANGEDVEVYRQRVLDRFQKRPQGGAYADYEIWGEEVEGILNIYPYTSDCPGQVDVFVEATVESSGDPDGIPTTAQLQSVLDSIELDQSGLATRRPANALANTFPITRKGFDVKVLGLQVDNLAEVQQDITDALTEYFLSREPFIAGLSVLPRLDRITQTAVGGVVDDIVSAAGGVFNSVTLTQNDVVVTLFILGQGVKAKLDQATFI